MKIQNAFFVAGFTFFTILSAWAFADEPVKPELSQVAYQIDSEKWVKTNLARVEVMANVSVKQAEFAQVREKIVEKLNRLAKAEWTITEFTHSQDSAGLEQLTVRAEARLPENKLNALYTDAKEISKPGESYRVNDIDFTPSLAEMNAKMEEARSEIYQKILNELANLKKLTNNPHYQIYRIDFNPYSNAPLFAAAGRSFNKTMMAVAQEASAPAPELSVGNKLRMNARVILAAPLA